MEFSLRKSFKSNGSYKHSRKISACDEDDSIREHQPILSDQHPPFHLHHREEREDEGTDQMRGSGVSDTREVIVKIDGVDNGFRNDNNNNQNLNRMDSNNNRIRRDTSYDFSFHRMNSGGSDWRSGSRGSVSSGGEGGENGGGVQEDPPSRLIGQFLEQQRVAGEMTLDLDLEMEELKHDRKSGLPPLPQENTSFRPSFSSLNLNSQAQSPEARSTNNSAFGSREVRVSFQERGMEPVRRRSTAYNDLGEATSSTDDEEEADHGSKIGDNPEVLKCSSNRTFDRMPTLSRNKTKSRLLDPPLHPDQRSGRIGKSGILKSGMLGKGCGGEDDEDDPLFEEDLPEEYMTEKISLLIVLEWLSLIFLIGSFICTLAIAGLREKRLWKLHLWKWEVLVLVVICGRLVSGWGIKILAFCIERNFMLRKRVLYFIYGLRKAVQNCIWLGLVLLTWHFLFDKKVKREANTEVLDFVTRFLVCCLVGAFIWLLKTLIVKVLASSFHVKAFFDRIQENVFNQFVIETLSGPPLYEIYNLQEEEEKTMAEVQMLQSAGATMPPELGASFFPPATSQKFVAGGPVQKSPIGKSSRLSGPISRKQDEGITLDRLHKLNQKNVSAWNMKRLIKIVRHRGLTTLDEQILDSTHEDESSMQIRSEVEAKAAARKIFRNVAKPRARYIYLDDLMHFMQEDEARKTMSLFEGASDSGRISKSSLKNWVVNAFRERRALALTLNDTKTAVNKLHNVVNILVSIIIGLIWLIILNIATSRFLLFVSSQVVLVAFVFGNTCKNVFESIIFLFIVHPFDVGDRCEIEGVQLIVEEMNILTTVFLRYDNNKVVYPNSYLLMKPIGNYYRSPDMGDAIEFHFHILTPPEKIALIKQRIFSYIESKKEHWYPTPMFVLKDIENLNMIRAAIWLQHRINYQDIAEKWARRALLLEECIKIFREHDIDYRFLPWNVNIRSLPPDTHSDPLYNWTRAAHEGEREMVHR